MPALAEDQAEFSPAALSGRLGTDLYALAVAAALAAPTPSPQKVEAIRRILSPVAGRVAESARKSARRPAMERAA
jgi:hypothetical protein